MAHLLPDSEMFSAGLKSSLIFFVFLSGCVTFRSYFNTFYNAKKTFYKAEKEFSKTKTINPNIEALYEKAIEKFLRIIKYFPDSPFIDDALYYTAISYLRINELKHSTRKFEELLEFFQDSPFIVLCFKETMAKLIEEKETERMTTVLNMFIESPSGKKIREEEYIYYRSQLSFYQEKYQESSQLSMEYLGKFPEGHYRDKIFLTLVRSKLEMGFPDSALPLIENFYTERESSEMRRELTLLLGDVYEEKEELEKAERVYYGLYKDTEDKLAFFKLTDVLQRLDRVDTLKALLRTFISESEEDTFKQKALYKLSLVLSEKDSLNKKREILEELKKMTPRTSYVQRAEVYLDILKTFAEKDTISSEKYITLAERYYLELNNPSMAKDILIEFLKKFPSADEIPRVLYTLFFLEYEILQNKDQAYLYLSRLKEDYPESFYLKEVKERFEVP